MKIRYKNLRKNLNLKAIINPYKRINLRNLSRTKNPGRIHLKKVRKATPTSPVGGAVKYDYIGYVFKIHSLFVLTFLLFSSPLRAFSVWGVPDHLGCSRHLFPISHAGLNCKQFPYPHSIQIYQDRWWKWFWYFTNSFWFFHEFSGLPSQFPKMIFPSLTSNTLMFDDIYSLMWRYSFSKIYSFSFMFW